MVELIPLMFALVTVFYIVATVAYLAFVIKPNDIVGRIGHWFVAAGFVIHLAVVVIRYFAGGYTPITNLHEALSFFALATAGVFIVFERSYRLTILGSFVMPIALVLLMASRTFPMNIAVLNPALKSGWLVIHTVVAFLGYATFAIAFGAGIMYLLQEHFLKQKRFGSLYQRLPSLDTLDDINYKSLTFGFPLLTVTIVSGAIWAESAWGTYWSWDPKETWSLITWFVYAALLHGRLTTGWRGRRAAILAIIGFLIVIFTFIGVNLLMTGKHAYN